MRDESDAVEKVFQRDNDRCDGSDICRIITSAFDKQRRGGIRSSVAGNGSDGGVVGLSERSRGASNCKSETCIYLQKETAYFQGGSTQSDYGSLEGLIIAEAEPTQDQVHRASH